MPLFFLIPLLLVTMPACVSVGVKPEDCPAGTQQLEGCPPIGAIDDPQIAELYASRTWRSADEQEVDPIEFGRTADVPINSARAKFIGSDPAGGLTSLAAKLHLIENAEHTIDVVYYIFKNDLVGLSVLGALCDAVQRGVDIRIMIDSMGSVSLNKKYLKALQSCAVDGGFIRAASGELTIYKARVQPVIFNATSRIFVNYNRRSHDKLLVADGRFGEKSAVMTGGRNISLSYYGILPDGSPNPGTYKDAEIFLRGADVEGESEEGVGLVSENYYDLLFLFKNNKLLKMTRSSDPAKTYAKEREQFRISLEQLKALPRLAQYVERMPDYVSSGFRDARVRLTHELTNLVNKDIVYSAVENADLNPNSVLTILRSLPDEDFTDVQIVSPYLFAALYKDKDKNVTLDGAKEILQWLEDDPDRKLHIVTNSALTSDSVFTQSVIDMDLAPRLLLTEELHEAWLQKTEEGEFNPELVESSEWISRINNPRLQIYETGRLDAVAFGGEVEYGKLHGKYIVSADWGFVGTTNFDYRSRLYNNEMGFLFESQGLADDMRENTKYLNGTSYLWGSPEWLEMRKQLMALKGSKGSAARKQRGIYKTLKKTGLIYLF
jgi:phosphatidylserine/phosphatidylglycerophosphate/cardiolipin synthase-like enzyme